MDEDYSRLCFPGCRWSINIDCQGEVEKVKFKPIKLTKRELKFIAFRKLNIKAINEAYDRTNPLPLEKDLIRLRKMKDHNK